MGYLTGNEITVDAILTKKGRELLAMGMSNFNVTQFAVADDEIDYGLYETAHPLGTAYYGSAIEKLPIVEASADETQNMRYKLVSLPQGTPSIPRLTVGALAPFTYKTTAPYQFQSLTVTTEQGFDGAQFGYTAILYNGSAASISAAQALPGQPTIPVYFGDRPTANAKVVVGLGPFTITADKYVTQVTTTQIVIIGNESGATATIPVIVNPSNS